jgi:SPP1 gp7 family putative phage head morphogenesis protein
MCESCAFDDSLLLLHDAGEFLGSLLGGCLALPVEKALDLSTPRGFDRAVTLLGARLRQNSRVSDAAAVRDAVDVLDVDWHSTTAEQRRRLIARSIQAAGKAVAPVVTAVQVPFSRTAEEVVAATRRDARRKQGLAISADFNALDRRIVRHVVRSQGNFVRDEYGRRLDDFSERARRIVADGLEQGLGRDDIASNLNEAAQAVLVNRSLSSWDVVASAFVGQGRSFAQMSSYAEAGLRTYVIEAVLDEVTTPICRFMHGKIFSVSDALARFDKVERMDDPEDIKQVMPWVRHGVDKENGRSVLYVNGADGRVPLAEVLRSGVGNRDDRGEYRAMASDGALASAGVGLPPFHGRCRSTVLSIS